MNGLKKFFLGKALTQSDDPFDYVKYVVLLNFSLFLLALNLPYTFLSYSSHPGHFVSALLQNAIMIVVIFMVQRAKNVRLAIGLFIGNFVIQNLFHFFINNGNLIDQGVLFCTLFVTITYILLGRKWGFAGMLFMASIIFVGVYNSSNNYPLFHLPAEWADPTAGPEMRYMIIFPFLLNAYLIGVFVQAQNKAKLQLSEQKKAVVEKNREITDSINYAKRIQTSLLPTEKYIVKALGKIKRAK